MINIDKEVTVQIPLNNFTHQNNNVDESSDNTSELLGRKNELSRFNDILKSTKNGGGTYLISGYRGIGKTRFVNEALDRYKVKVNTNALDIRINLGNDSRLDSKTILSDMVSLLAEKIHSRTNKLLSFIYRITLPLVFITLSVFLLLSLKEGGIIRLGFTPNSDLALYFLLFSLSAIPIRFIIYSTSTYIRTSNKLNRILTQIHCSTETSRAMGAKYINFGRKHYSKPLNTNEIEAKLRHILNETKELDVIYIFDELDKLSGTISDDFHTGVGVIEESKYRKRQVDRLLGELKNLITSSRARYIFIAGRDMYDAYLSESGSSNSLYESLFSDQIYIPSLLTDHSDENVYFLDSMIETFVVSKLLTMDNIKDAKEKRDKNIDESNKIGDMELQYGKLHAYNIFLEEFNNEDICCDIDCRYTRIYILKIFTHFLVLHSWGNYKRLITLFESFVRVVKNKDEGSNQYELYFTTQSIQRLVLSSHLYILFHHNLSRELMHADDKLVVSAFSVFHYIMKFHGMGFSRSHINRMYETINIHSSPELTKIVDIIIFDILNNHIRRVRNSFYRYRFSSLHEKEIHFITMISDHESATFNFSLDAMDNVKQHYLNLLAEEKSTLGCSSIHVIIGNYYLWEQSYDEADIHYGIAAGILEETLKKQEDNARRVYNKDDCADKSDKYNSVDASIIVQLTEIYLKQASVAERSGNYSLAVTIYVKSEQKLGMYKVPDRVHKHDSKLDVIHQPTWARQFLNLKRSAIHYKEYGSNVGNQDWDDKTNPVNVYRHGVMNYFLENHVTSYRLFITVARSNKINVLNKHHEQASFLGGNACLRAAFSLLSKYGHDHHRKLTNNYYINETTNTDAAFINTLTDFLKSISCVLNKSLSNKTLAELEEYSLKQKKSDSIQTTKRFHERISRALDSHSVYPDNFENNVLLNSIGLMAISASTFRRCGLHANAAISYLSIVMMWEVFLEMLPWRLLRGDSTLLTKISGVNKKKLIELEKIMNEIVSKVETIRRGPNNWVEEAQNNAFECSGKITKKALSHFMKTALHRNLGISLQDTLFANNASARDLVLDDEFTDKFIYQHYSVFGQMAVAFIHWEDMAQSSVLNKVSASKPSDNILPYSIRYYSIMLWLKGKKYHQQLLDYAREKPVPEEETNATDNGVLPEKMKEMAVNAVVNLFRASQYMTKTGGESANIALPPIFVVYFGLWEVIFTLVSEYTNRIDTKKYSFEEVMVSVRDELDNELKNCMDVSSRVLDLAYLEHEVLDKLKIVEKMGDPNSRERTNVFKNKYYLDDDYEDNLFNLEWCYCRTFTPSAFAHRLVIEFEMKKLKGLFDQPDL